MDRWLLVPLVVGLSQPVLWQMNVRVARATGSTESAVVLHAVGTLAGLVLLLAGLRGRGFGGLAEVPGWAFLAGILGVAGMAAMNRAIPQVGVAPVLAVLVAAQLSFAVLFEHGGWMGAVVHPATLGRGVGILLLAAGAFLVSR